ncbi:hypothetical protein TPHA_0I02540 [Tetrapisispora phaffii CBS 4417]|uniref:Uncharacterized protein n=1 Tax=Tetrapisispora phaffii (strain ATCC 24235 / CBS 4417 / NBRC 1672 / NRRL Y-8282 / UCD 70-5) TaxID=1071381 RepID=G8BXX7_TETPH|nr:hypothetical protein TPHA_0I02540 [Tetrapisispora phaffii CBS 4417]CCE64755.1 hypothetical protein TPHA_0I02540 [Tetrapisispora phaffii CBS 4417]
MFWIILNTGMIIEGERYITMKIQFNSNINIENRGYTAHNVPCKIRYSGPSDEFEDNFIFDEDNTNDMYVNYLRGCKIVGQEINSVFDKEVNCYLMDVTGDMDISESHNDKNGDSDNKKLESISLVPVAKILKVINYERDGNESRLVEEMGKFEESLELNELIHG